MTASAVASSKTWQVSVLGWSDLGWSVGGDGMVVGGVMAVGMDVAVDGDGTGDGDEVGGGGGC
jgi:hypothetical protein